MNGSMTISHYELARLVGLFAHPVPDAGERPFGPPAPLVRNATHLRQVARAVIGWAMRIGDLASVESLEFGSGDAREEAPRDSGDKGGAPKGGPYKSDPGKGDEGGATTQGDNPVGKGPPASAVHNLIQPSIRALVDDYCGNGRFVRLPVPIHWPWPAPDPDPWHLGFETERERQLGRVLMAMEFSFAAATLQRGALRTLFEESAIRLFERGVGPASMTARSH